MIRISISQAAFDAIASAIALGMILLAAPACAGSRFGGGFHSRLQVAILQMEPGTKNEVDLDGTRDTKRDIRIAMLIEKVA